MFSKAKLKRFNEEVGCAPPPTAYNPKKDDKTAPAMSMDRSERWRASAKDTPGPGAYCIVAPSPLKKQSGSSHLNTSTISTCSNGSSTSGSGLFLSPPKPRTLLRSVSARVTQGQHRELEETIHELQEQIKKLSGERTQMVHNKDVLEAQLEELKSKVCRKEMKDAATNVDTEEVCDGQHESRDSSDLVRRGSCVCASIITAADSGASTEEALEMKRKLETTQQDLIEAQQAISSLKDEHSGLQLKLKQVEESTEQKSLTEEELETVKERVDHLTVLRDNLEASLLVKEDLIAELQLQLDEVVVEGRGYHDRMQQLEVEIERSRREQGEAEHRVKSLVSRYEALVSEQREERQVNREMQARKDIEIELLNASLGNLNRKIGEFEQTISFLQDEVDNRRGKISVLESNLSDLSMITKEKEVMESMMEEEINHRTEEVTKLEQTLHEVEGTLSEVCKERDELLTTLKTERKKMAELNDKLTQCETQIKEKEVVQQFLEKEIAAREAEIAESSARLKELESDLETTQQMVLDLQQEAEAHLNKALTLEQAVTQKEQDLDTKGVLITTLQTEVSQKANHASALQERLDSQVSTTLKLEENLSTHEEKVRNLREELCSVKETLKYRSDSLAALEHKTSNLEKENHQLEEKVVELMGEISDREAEHITKLRHVESDLEDLGVKYSEALLEHEATRRALTQTSQQLEKENLLRLASEADLETLKKDLEKQQEEIRTMEVNMKDLVQKYTNLEDALACEEAENRDLEERLEQEKRAAQDTAAALEALQTSSAGFCTQITQLKIDMRKKSQAVEEMQLCIEALREEKLHLTNLRDNLESSMEGKEHTIAQLHLQASTQQREMEEERVDLRSKMADLQNHLKERETEVKNNKELITSLEDKLSGLEEANAELSKAYEEQLQQKTLEHTQLQAKLETLERQYEVYRDQLNNMETSLAEQKEQYEEKMKTAIETGSNEVRQTWELQRRQMEDSHNTAMQALNKKLESLAQDVEAKSSQVEECHSQLQQAEEERSTLAAEKEKAEDTITSLQHILTTTTEQLSRLETTFNEEKSVEVSRLTLSLETDLQDLKTSRTSLLDELNSWKSKYEHLEKLIEPFRDQLDQYEVERSSLLQRSSEAKEEVDKLGKQYATLLGHQNHKQKIHHVLQLKTENSRLRDEVYKLRAENERQKKTVKRAEEKLSRVCGSTSRLNDTSKLLGDKENSFHVAAATPGMASTPLKSLNRQQRL